jgi:hypothetical protein
MIKVLALILAAFILGASMMFIPIAVFVYVDVKTQENQNFIGGTNQTQSQIEGERCRNATDFFGDMSCLLQDFKEITRDAFVYGQMDIEPVPSPSNIKHAALLVVVSLAAAAGVSFYFKRKMELL